MNEIKLSEIIQSYKEQSLFSNNIGESFQNAFLETLVKYYKNELQELFVDIEDFDNTILLDVKMLNSSQYIKRVVKFLWNKVNVTLTKTPGDKTWANKIRYWFPAFDEYKAGGSIPEKSSIYRLALILKWTAKDCNKLFEALEFQRTEFCGSLADTIYHYALMFGKGYIWAEDLIQELESKRISLFNSEEKHYDTASGLTKNVQDTISKIFKEIDKEYLLSTDETLTSKKSEDEQFITKIENLLFDFNGNSSAALSVLRAISSGGSKLTGRMMCYLWQIDGKKNTAIWSKIHVERVIRDVAPRGKIIDGVSHIKKISKTEKVPTRDFLIMYSVTRYAYDNESRSYKSSLMKYVNENLTSANFSILNSNKKFDNFILELSKYSINSKENTVYYNGIKVSNLDGLIDHNILSKSLSKRYAFAKIFSFIILKYYKKINVFDIFDSVELINNGLRINYY